MHIRSLLSKAEGQHDDYLICATAELRVLFSELDSARDALRNIAQMWPPEQSGKEMQARALREFVSEKAVASTLGKSRS